MGKETYLSKFDELIDCFPTALRKHIPIYTDSLSHFILLLKNREAKHVDGEVLIQPPPMWLFGRSTTVGTIGNFKYSARYSAELDNKRTLYYEECFGNRFGSTLGSSDAEDRKIWEIKSLITINKRLKKMRELVLLLGTDIIPGSNSDRFTEEDYQKLEKCAKRFNVSPFGYKDLKLS